MATTTTKGGAREARAPVVFVATVVSVASVATAVCDHVVTVQHVDDIDEVHQLDPVRQVDHKDELWGDPGRTFRVFSSKSSHFVPLWAILGPSWGFLGRLGAAGPFCAMWASFSRKKVPVYCILRVIGAQGEFCAG